MIDYYGACTFNPSIVPRGEPYFNFQTRNRCREVNIFVLSTCYLMLAGILGFRPKSSSIPNSFSESLCTVAPKQSILTKGTWTCVSTPTNFAEKINALYSQKVSRTIIAI